VTRQFQFLHRSQPFQLSDQLPRECQSLTLGNGMLGYTRGNERMNEKQEKITEDKHKHILKEIVVLQEKMSELSRKEKRRGTIGKFNAKK